MATRRRSEEVRGATQLSIGPEGPVSLPRDSSETLALLLSRGLICAYRDDHAIGRPLIYAPTPRLLQLLDVATLEEAKRRMGVPTHYRSGGSMPESEPSAESQAVSNGEPRVVLYEDEERSQLISARRTGDQLAT